MLIQERFYHLYNKWKEETQFDACSQINDSAKDIIALGKPILHLLFANLFDSWLPILLIPYILNSVSFEIPESERGIFFLISKRYYEYGQINGYVV